VPINQQSRKDILKFIEKFRKDRDLEEDKNVKIGFMSDDEEIGKIERLPTGVIGFDTLTGGGFIKGKINQIYGEEGCGKSTLILRSIGNIQARDPDFIANYQNNEKTLDREYVAFNSIDQERFLVGEFTTNEEVADFCNFVTEPNSHISLSAFDTIQALSCNGELYKGEKEKSVKDNTIALIPRMYSQFLRMYTSKSVGHLTLILSSQIRMDLGSFIPSKRETGGNAIKHYNILTVEMQKAAISSNWPGGKDELPPKSFPVRLKIRKAKLMNRYEGNELMIYFYKGSFEHKFNVVAIAKDLELHDGKSLTYTVQEGDLLVEKEFKARNFYDFYNKIPDSAVEWLEKKIPEAYTQSIMIHKPSTE
jgi:RecA/RadA recombinase